MLFYTSRKHIDDIPSSYIIIFVSEKRIKVRPNIIELDQLFPEPLCQGSESLKNKYMKYLNRDYVKKYIVSLVLQLSKCANIVIMYDSDEKDYVGYNYAKVICQYIYNRYGYAYYKFTNDIDIDMMRDSRIKKHDNYVADIDKLKGEIKDAKLILTSSLSDR